MTENELLNTLRTIEAAAKELREEWGNLSSVTMDDLSATLLVNVNAVMPALGRGVIDTERAHGSYTRPQEHRKCRCCAYQLREVGCDCGAEG